MSQPTRDDILKAAKQLRDAAHLLEAHARRCTDPTAPAHQLALHRATGMVRSLVTSQKKPA